MLLLTQEIIEQTEEIKEQTNFFIEYVKGLVPDLLDFAVQLVIAIIIFAIGTKVIKFLRKVSMRAMDRAGWEEGVKSFLDSLIKCVLYFLLIVMIATKFGVTTSSVIALLGSAGLAVGLALQGSLSNFAGGVLILLLKPFEIGDYVVTGDGKEGVVTTIQICYTRLTTADNRVVVIPNGQLSDGVITNVTKMDKRRLDLTVGVGYDADLSKVKMVLNNVALEEEYRMEEEPIDIFVEALGESNVLMGVRIWVKTEDYWNAKWSLTEDVKKALDENGIQIPFPKLDVNLMEK